MKKTSKAIFVPLDINDVESLLFGRLIPNSVNSISYLLSRPIRWNVNVSRAMTIQITFFCSQQTRC